MGIILPVVRCPGGRTSSARPGTAPDTALDTQYEDLLRHVLATGTPQVGPHRHRDAQRLRPPAALRPVGGLPAGHDQAGALPLDRLRAAVVPARRPQRRLAAGARRDDLGRVGRRRTATSARSTACSGGPGRRPTAATSTRSASVLEQLRSDPDSRRHDRLGVERRRDPADGAAAVPRALPVLRRRRPAVLPALPAQRRPVPRRPVQHRQLRPAHAHGRPAGRARGRRLRLDRRRLPHLRQPRRPGARAALPARPSRSRGWSCAGAPSLFDYAYEDFEVVGYQHHPALRAPVAV